jgi:small multidrug resistance family-3 protein
MAAYIWFALAAVCEIGGCYAVWMWLRLGRSPLWLAAGLASLACFAVLLTRVDTDFAGRAYAAYGGVYIVASLSWLAVVEGTRPLLSDLGGAALCLIGSALILLGPRWV